MGQVLCPYGCGKRWIGDNEMGIMAQNVAAHLHFQHGWDQDKIQAWLKSVT